MKLKTHTRILLSLALLMGGIAGAWILGLNELLANDSVDQVYDTDNVGQIYDADSDTDLDTDEHLDYK